MATSHTWLFSGLNETGAACPPILTGVQVFHFLRHPTSMPVPRLDASRYPVAATRLRKNKEPHTEVGKIGLFVLIKPSEEAKTWAKTKNKTGNSLEKK